MSDCSNQSVEARAWKRARLASRGDFGSKHLYSFFLTVLMPGHHNRLQSSTGRISLPWNPVSQNYVSSPWAWWC